MITRWVISSEDFTGKIRLRSEMAGTQPRTPSPGSQRGRSQMIRLEMNTRRPFSLFLLFMLAAGLLLPRTVIAQVDMGSISGTVRDTSGAVLPGVKVTLSNVDTGVTSSTTTGSEGQYTFSPIKIGHYSVSATASGFRTVHQNNVTVDVQQKVEVNLSLPVGQATE